MISHKFKVGQTVSFLPDARDQYDLRGSYTIARLLPSETRDLQYRIKSNHDGHERIVRESQLAIMSPVFSSPASWPQTAKTP